MFLPRRRGAALASPRPGPAPRPAIVLPIVSSSSSCAIPTPRSSCGTPSRPATCGEAFLSPPALLPVVSNLLRAALPLLRLLRLCRSRRRRRRRREPPALQVRRGDRGAPVRDPRDGVHGAFAHIGSPAAVAAASIPSDTPVAVIVVSFGGEEPRAKQPPEPDAPTPEGGRQGGDASLLEAAAELGLIIRQRQEAPENPNTNPRPPRGEGVESSGNRQRRRTRGANKVRSSCMAKKCPVCPGGQPTPIPPPPRPTPPRMSLHRGLELPPTATYRERLKANNWHGVANNNKTTTIHQQQQPQTPTTTATDCSSATPFIRLAQQHTFAAPPASSSGPSPSPPPPWRQTPSTSGSGLESPRVQRGPTSRACSAPAPTLAAGRFVSSCLSRLRSTPNGAR